VWGPDIYVERGRSTCNIPPPAQGAHIEESVDVIRTVRAAGYALDLSGDQAA